MTNKRERGPFRCGCWLLRYAYLDAARPCALNLENGLRHSRGADERRIGGVEDDDGALRDNNPATCPHARGGGDRGGGG